MITKAQNERAGGWRRPLACSNIIMHPLKPMHGCLMNPSNKVGGPAESGRPVERACPLTLANRPPRVHIRFKSNLSCAVALSRVRSYYTYMFNIGGSKSRS